MTIFTLQVSTDNPMPLLHRRIPTPRCQQSHQELKATLCQGIFSVIPWKDGPARVLWASCSLSPSAIQQLLPKVSLWFAGLDSCHCVTAPLNHPAGAFAEGKLTQAQMLQGASQDCVTLGHSQPHSQ